jgi:CDP-glucose 4,6-dehydratase
MADRDQWGDRSVLVTGAGGFVGSHLARALADAGANVTAILRDQPVGSSFHLLGLVERVNIVMGSMTDGALIERAVNEYRVDSCFHLGAQAIVGVANRSPLSTFESNIEGTWTVLEALRRSDLLERVVVASSDKAYGNQEHLPYTEDMPLLADNPYDVSKLCTDVIARSYHSAFAMPVTVARCANIYGPADMNFSRLVPDTVRSALSGRRPFIRSDGTPLRDYIHVDDAVSAYLTLGESARRAEVAGQAFNFGSNSPISVIDMVGAVLRASDRPDLVPDVRGSGPGANEIASQYLDSSRANATLGWTAAVSLDEGLRSTVRWYREYLAQHPMEAPSN